MIILVDKNDKQIGAEEKIKVHREGKLHRAFSIFIFSSDGKMLLQERAKTKYHSGGLWTNACCSHPRTGEKLEESVHRRLKEEMGFDCDLKKIGEFIYNVKVGELTEYEYDHVFIGKYDSAVIPNPEEADAFKWIDIDELKKDMKRHPELYTEWFKILFSEFLSAFERFAKEKNKKII